MSPDKFRVCELEVWNSELWFLGGHESVDIVGILSMDFLNQLFAVVFLEHQSCLEIQLFFLLILLRRMTSESTLCERGEYLVART